LKKGKLESEKIGEGITRSGLRKRRKRQKLKR